MSNVSDERLEQLAQRLESLFLVLADPRDGQVAACLRELQQAREALRQISDNRFFGQR